jgi:hypothetical protein
MSPAHLFAALLAVNILAPSAGAQTLEPWKEPQDSAEAINNPDRYIWRVFVALNWPADVKQKKADASKKFGDAAPGPVTWETWRNARNEAPDTAFPLDGSDPGPWLGKESSSEKLVSSFDDGPLQQLIRRNILRNAKGPLPAFDDASARTRTNETRLNQAAFEFLRSKKLYNADEQIKLFTSGQVTIEFPLAAKEIKAQWREISSADKPRYHWVEVKSGAATKLYGLTALHITTKDLPNWLWATFEHIDNKLSQANGGRPGNEGWLLPSRDRFACANPPYDCELSPAGIGLQGTKWENYRLRGTQIDFVDSRGKTTLLANSNPESGFQTTSSCITCHARATISATDRLSVFKCVKNDEIAEGAVGPPSLGWFVGADGKAKFTQLDFVWSFFRARRSNGTGVSPMGEPECPPN